MSTLKATAFILAAVHSWSAVFGDDSIKPPVVTEDKTVTTVAATSAGKNIVPDGMKARQREAAWRKRRIIMNNDGNDCFMMGG